MLFVLRTEMIASNLDSQHGGVFCNQPCGRSMQFDCHRRRRPAAYGLQECQRPSSGEKIDRCLAGNRRAKQVEQRFATTRSFIGRVRRSPKYLSFRPRKGPPIIRTPAVSSVFTCFGDFFGPPFSEAFSSDMM